MFAFLKQALSELSADRADKRPFANWTSSATTCSPISVCAAINCRQSHWNWGASSSARIRQRPFTSPNSNLADKPSRRNCPTGVRRRGALPRRAWPFPRPANLSSAHSRRRSRIVRARRDPGRLQIPKSTLAHHIAQLVSAGLMTQRREGRVQRCHVDVERSRHLLKFLIADCCEGLPGLAELLRAVQ